MSEILSNVELKNKIVSLSGYRSDLPKDYELGFNECQSKVLEIIEKYGYDNVVCVPEYVAVWFEENKHALEVAIFRAIAKIMEKKEENYTKFLKWLNDDSNKPIETLIRMQECYTVRPIYRVRNLQDGTYFKQFSGNDFNAVWCSALVEAYEFDTEAKAESVCLLTNFECEVVH
jgi:hypothetical protein